MKLFRKFEKWSVNLQCFTGERKSEMQFPFFFVKKLGLERMDFMARRIFSFEGTKWEVPSKMNCTCSLSFPQAIQGFPLVCQSQSCIVIRISSLVIKRVV